MIYNSDFAPGNIEVNKKGDHIWGSISNSNGEFRFGESSVRMRDEDEDDEEKYNRYNATLFYKNPGKGGEYDEYRGVVIMYKDGSLRRYGMGRLNEEREMAWDEVRHLVRQNPKAKSKPPERDDYELPGGAGNKKRKFTIRSSNKRKHKGTKKLIK
jgi:hypothetical protein